MKPPPFERTLPHLNVGTIGQFGHGKTTLSSAISQVLAKNPGAISRPLSAREISRGGFLPRVSWRGDATSRDFFRAPNTWEGWEQCTSRPEVISYQSPRRHYAHLDCPGHFSRWRTTASALSLLDAAVLVVSALDSVAAQTREHLILARQAGVSQLVVFLSHCDQAQDAELLDLVEIEVRELLSEYGFSGDAAPLVRGAALPACEGDPLWEASILSLLEALDALPQPPRDLEVPPLVSILRGYPITGRGTAVEGLLRRGTLRRGAELELLGLLPKRSTVATSLEIFEAPTEEAQAGDYVGVLLRGVQRYEARRGRVLAPPRTVQPARRFLCDLGLLTQKEGGRSRPIFTGYQAHFALGAASVTGVVRLSPEEPMLMPKERFSKVNVELIAPVYLREGMGFSFRDGCDGFQRARGGERVWGGTGGTGVITRVLPDEP